MIILTGWASAQESVQFVFEHGDKLRILEKTNLRIREDGVYRGYLYRETRGVFSAVDPSAIRGAAARDAAAFAGVAYVLEDVKDNKKQAKRIEDAVPAEFFVRSDGSFIVLNSAIHPRLRGFPTFSHRPIRENEAWRTYGTRVVDPNGDGTNTAIEFYCEYLYQGQQFYQGRDVHVIKAQYATRYKIGQDPYGDPNLTEASGKHVANIIIDVEDSSRIFIRDQVDEVFIYREGPDISYQGFILTWFGDVAYMDRSQVVEDIKETLSTQKVEDISVVEHEEGVALSLQKIHFVPDSPQILPDERSRLDAVFAVLNSLKERTIKVIGHTADIGTQESQYELSVERAKTVVDEMTKRGLDPERFIYEGRGGTDPVASNDTEEGRALNRRVEIVILED